MMLLILLKPIVFYFACIAMNFSRTMPAPLARLYTNYHCESMAATY